MKRIVAFAVVLGASTHATLPSQQSGCRPVDAAWAISLTIRDAATGKAVTNAVASNLSDVAETDSVGHLCIRDLAAAAETLSISRPGYRDTALVMRGVTGQVVSRELRFARVVTPCCDLRGQWRITLQLDHPGAGQPSPKTRTVSGAVKLGPRYLAAQANDDLDSLVHVVRGMHEVDFTPFFGGPVGHDVSTSVFGSGPDLVHEVAASIPSGDSVDITFIPRMSHGSLSFYGTIHGDTVRGSWVQNMYCCGAEGRFVMTRTAIDSTPVPRRAAAKPYRRTLRIGPAAAAVPAGLAPNSHWRPELSVDPNGRLWLASGGLFVADRFGAAWRRVLGSDNDPVAADELRIGIRLGFVGERTAILGLNWRYPAEHAPVVYRTDDGGATWSPVALDSVYDVDAIGAVGRSVWVVAQLRDHKREGLFASADGGKTWRAMPVPPRLYWVAALYRVSADTAYLATNSDPGAPALWRTTDGARQWLPLPTPSDQHLLKLEHSDSRVEQIATIGRWLLVNEHGRVFASPVDSMRWRPLAGVDAIASEPGGDRVFALFDGSRPAFLNRNLAVDWRSAQPLTPHDDDIEQVVLRGGTGYVSETNGSIHQIRNTTLRVLRPQPDGRTSDSARVFIEKP